MEKSDPFKVKFSGLKIGKHDLELKADDAFFEKHGYGQDHRGEVNVALTLEKRATMLVLDLHLSGSLMEECDRCAVRYSQPIDGTHRIYVKFGETDEEPSDELIVIPHEAFEIDLSQTVHDFVQLDSPIRKVPCEETGNTEMCDSEVLRILEQQESDKEQEGNPMWEALQGLKEQLKKK